MDRDKSSVLAEIIFGLLIWTIAAVTMAETTVTALMGSKHFGNEYGYEFNEVNSGIGIECNNFGALIYENSYSDTSVIGYYNIELYDSSGISAGVLAGAVTNYYDRPLTPVGVAYAQYKYAFIGVIPSFLASDKEDVDYASAVVMFGLRFDL